MKAEDSKPGLSWSDTSIRSALTLLLVAVSATPSSAGLVFSALEGGAWHLYYQADPDSAPEPVQARDITGDMGAARLSPDGTEVAFEVTGAGIHVCPIHGEGACRSLDEEGGFAVRPAWHPDTSGLVFSRFTFQAAEEVSTLHRADASLEQVEPIIQQTGIQDFPDVSPGGSRLAYTSWLTVMPYRGGVRVVQQLWTLNLTRGEAGQLLLSNASDIHPRWSPDGNRLAFSSNRTGRYQIFTVGADGSDLKQVTRGSGDKTWPAWSPDGERILFTDVREGRSGLSLVTLGTGEILPYQPFGVDAGIQLKDADWRTAPE